MEQRYNESKWTGLGSRYDTPRKKGVSSYSFDHRAIMVRKRQWKDRIWRMKSGRGRGRGRERSSTIMTMNITMTMMVIMMMTTMEIMVSSLPMIRSIPQIGIVKSGGHWNIPAFATPMIRTIRNGGCTYTSTSKTTSSSAYSPRSSLMISRRMEFSNDETFANATSAVSRRGRDGRLFRTSKRRSSRIHDGTGIGVRVSTTRTHTTNTQSVPTSTSRKSSSSSNNNETEKNDNQDDSKRGGGRTSPFPAMPSQIFCSLADSQFELLANSLFYPSPPTTTTINTNNNNTNKDKRPKIKSMALYLPAENPNTGQLEFLPAVVYPSPNTERIFIASDASAGTPPTLPPTLTKLPGFAHAQSLLPAYPFAGTASTATTGPGASIAAVGTVEEVMCDIRSTVNTDTDTGGSNRNNNNPPPLATLSLPLFRGSRTIGVLLIYPSPPPPLPPSNTNTNHNNYTPYEWTDEDKLQVSRAANSLAQALVMDAERTETRMEAEEFRLALEDSLHQVKNPLQAMRTFAKLLQRQIVLEQAEAERRQGSGASSSSSSSTSAADLEGVYDSDGTGDGDGNVAGGATGKNTKTNLVSTMPQLVALAENMIVQSDRVVDLLLPMDTIIHNSLDSNDDNDRAKKDSSLGGGGTKSKLYLAPFRSELALRSPPDQSQSQSEFPTPPSALSLSSSSDSPPSALTSMLRHLRIDEDDERENNSVDATVTDTSFLPSPSLQSISNSNSNSNSSREDVRTMGIMEFTRSPSASSTSSTITNRNVLSKPPTNEPWINATTTTTTTQTSNNTSDAIAAEEKDKPEFTKLPSSSTRQKQSNTNANAHPQTDLTLEMAFVPDVLEPIISASRAMALERDINFQVVGMQSELPGVTLCPRSLREAVSNVLDNAIKYVTLGKDGVAGVENDHPMVRVTLLPNSDEIKPGVTILVEDNGPGIPKDEREIVFFRGYRGDSIRFISPGSGIGLDIGRGMVLRMGGLLEIVDSDQGLEGGEGSLFLGGTVMRFVLFRNVN